MATEYITTVKSSGGDYTSLSGWEAGFGSNTGTHNGDIVTGDIIETAECYAFQDTSNTMIDGWTTDATRYIKIYTPTAERHDGKWNTTSAYRIYANGGGGNGVEIRESYTRVEGLQVQLHTYANSCFRLNAGGIRVSNCVVRGVLAASYNGILVVTEGTGVGNYVWNNIIYDFTNGIYHSAEDQASPIYNNTVHNCTTGILGGTQATLVLKNNVVQDCTTCYSNSFHAQ